MLFKNNVFTLITIQMAHLRAVMHNGQTD